MKQTITQWLYMDLDVHMQPDGTYGDNYEDVWAPTVYRFKPDDNEKRVFIRAIQIEVDVPDDFDPTGRQIAALEDKKAKASEAYYGLVAQINEQISKLQAISYSGAES